MKEELSKLILDDYTLPIYSSFQAGTTAPKYVKCIVKLTCRPYLKLVENSSEISTELIDRLITLASTTPISIIDQFSIFLLASLTAVAILPYWYPNGRIWLNSSDKEEIKLSILFFIIGCIVD